MSREDPQMKLRLPEEMHARLKAEAEANKRSMNAEIVARLEDTLGMADRMQAAFERARVNTRKEAGEVEMVHLLEHLETIRAHLQRIEDQAAENGRQPKKAG